MQHNGDWPILWYLSLLNCSIVVESLFILKLGLQHCVNKLIILSKTETEYMFAYNFN